MPQNTLSAARVIDPVLTEIARGYRNAQMVGLSIFPYVPVQQRGGKIIQFGKEHFRLYNTQRAPGAQVARMLSAYSSLSYALESHSIEAPVADELREEAAAVPGVNEGMAASRRAQDVIALRLELAQASLATTAGNYGASNKITLAGASQWSDPGSDPIAAIETAKEAVRTQIGRRPNTLVVSASVFAALKNHSKITDRIKYTGRDIASPALLASLFDLSNVVVGDAVYQNDAGAMVDVWGKFAVLAYTDTASVADAGAPSFGYTYRLAAYPVVEPPYRENGIKSWVYQVSDEVAPVIAGAEAGYLFSAAVA